VFLKNPENKKRGSMTIGITALTDLLSVTIVPNMRPRDIPLKEPR
jgi:hypothetical protein